MSYTTEMLEAMAVAIAGAGIAKWEPAGTYTDPDTGLFIGLIPPTPDRIICLTPYPVTDELKASDSVLGVQVRYRGTADPRTVYDLSDAVFNLLHGKELLGWASGRTVEIARNSGAPLGQDQNGRQEATENYYLTAWRPSANRI